MNQLKLRRSKAFPRHGAAPLAAAAAAADNVDMSNAEPLPVQQGVAFGHAAAADPPSAGLQYAFAFNPFNPGVPAAAANPVNIFVNPGGIFANPGVPAAAANPPAAAAAHLPAPVLHQGFAFTQGGPPAAANPPAAAAAHPLGIFANPGGIFANPGVPVAAAHPPAAASHYGFAFTEGDPSSGGKRRKRTKCTYRKRRNLKRTRRGRK